MQSKSFLIPNISCAHCVRTIQNEVGDLPGVVSIKADQDTKMVTVAWNEPPQSWAGIKNLLVEINYPPVN